MDSFRKKLIFAEIELLLLIITIPCFALPLWSVTYYGEKISENFFVFINTPFTIYNFFSVIAHWGTVIIVVILLFVTINTISNNKKGIANNISGTEGIIVSFIFIFNAICILTSSGKYEPKGTISVGSYLDVGGYIVSMLLIAFAILFSVDNYIVNNPHSPFSNNNKNDNNQIQPTTDNQNASELKEQLSDADELAKWKKLLDDNAITQEEYDKKKKEILK